MLHTSHWPARRLRGGPFILGVCPVVFGEGGKEMDWRGEMNPMSRYEYAKSHFPNAELTCKHIWFNDWWYGHAIDLVATCNIDASYRNCTERCSKYRPTLAFTLLKLFKGVAHETNS